MLNFCWTYLTTPNSSPADLKRSIDLTLYFIIDRLAALNGTSLRQRFMATKTIKIPFTENEQRFLSFVFMEVFGGGSTGAIQDILGELVSDAKALAPMVRQQAQNDSEQIELTEAQWRVMYASMNAVIYGLGPGELHTCTGQSLHDVCNLNLRLCKHVWGAYKGRYEWAESKSIRCEP